MRPRELMQELCHMIAPMLVMTSAVLCTTRQMTAPTLAADLHAAGIAVLATVPDCSKLVQAVVLHAPDVLVCDVAQPSSAWFQALQVVGQTVPCPIIVFTHDADASHIAQATECGVHVYVVHGYGANRLRSLIHLAQARFKQAQAQRHAYEEIATRFEERKAVDRAKGILMRSQQLSDDAAYSALRSAGMRSNQRMGQLSLHVIQSAQVAEAMNRSGQLRMLSQRLVKLHLLQQAGVQAELHGALLQESVARVESNFALLRKNLSQPTYGDLLEQVAQTWEQLKQALAQGNVEAVDQGAEALLQGAERLTTSLETTDAAAPLQVLNLAGRQRMLSQRFAKNALLVLAGQSAAQSAMRTAQQEFEVALTYLNGIPLSTPAIALALQAAGIAWVQMLSAVVQTQRLEELAQGSETLLDLFEELSGHYESSMQMLVD